VVGEQITERGVGNGISMIIFAGCCRIAKFGNSVFTSVQNGQGSLIGLAVFALSLAVLLRLCLLKAQRRSSELCTKTARSSCFTAQQTHLPLKINMAGVIPAIFASSLLLFPASLGQWLVVLIQMQDYET
jgi:preprotein translocase subunit SecY